MSEDKSNGKLDSNEYNRRINNTISSLKRSVHLPYIRRTNISPQVNKLLNEINKKKESNSIFITDYNSNKLDFKTIKPIRRRNLITSYNDKDIKSIEDFNVFLNEDNFIKSLMDKFNYKSQPKIPKKEKRKQIFNKLYGINPKFIERMDKAKRNKDLPLEEYQANTFRILTTNDISKSELNDLAFSLKNLRIQSESVSPLPPFKINLIYDHVYKTNNNNNKKRKLNKLSFKQILYESTEPKDEFEKEEKLIKKLMSYRTTHITKRDKAFDILPEYLKDALSKRFKHNT